jgi:predicted nuclease of predicted toxin-antitoxin system
VKLLFDQNISFRVVDRIKALFPQSSHVKDFNLQFATDRQIWNFAKENQYDIVTFDADFYDLVTLYGHPPKIIWIRLGNTSSDNLVRIFSVRAALIKSFLTEDNFREFACLEIDH